MYLLCSAFTFGSTERGGRERGRRNLFFLFPPFSPFPKCKSNRRFRPGKRGEGRKGEMIHGAFAPPSKLKRHFPLLFAQWNYFLHEVKQILIGLYHPFLPSALPLFFLADASRKIIDMHERTRTPPHIPTLPTPTSCRMCSRRGSRRFFAPF